MIRELQAFEFEEDDFAKITGAGLGQKIARDDNGKVLKDDKGNTIMNEVIEVTVKLPNGTEKPKQLSSSEVKQMTGKFHSDDTDQWIGKEVVCHKMQMVGRDGSTIEYVRLEPVPIRKEITGKKGAA